MLSENEKSLMRRCLASLREGMPGFTTRHAQLAMMAEVANTLGAVHGAYSSPRDHVFQHLDHRVTWTSQSGQHDIAKSCGRCRPKAAVDERRL